MAPGITLVLGGARSGKSAVAERLAAASSTDGAAGGVTYVATGPVLPDDPDWCSRVAAHQARRPAGWRTVELPDAGILPTILLGEKALVLVDSLGTWLARAPRFAVDARQLCDALAERRRLGRPSILVAEETGMGVHPETDAGRRFRDALGLLNAAVAAIADRALLVVAGRVLELARAGEV